LGGSGRAAGRAEQAGPGKSLGFVGRTVGRPEKAGPNADVITLFTAAIYVCS
jgi:hypothetical protein